MSNEPIETSRVRELLRRLLRSDTDLDSFCLDYFREVHQRFSSGMERTQKENLLLIHALTPEAILAALRTRFPKDVVWDTLRVSDHHALTTSDALRGQPRRVCLSPRTGGCLAVIGLAAVWLWRVWTPSQTACGALRIDDLFLLKQPTADEGPQLVLDVRLRHVGQPPATVNITRASLSLLDKQPERASYPVSANYDLLISGDSSSSPLAQRLSAGEVDRIVLRLGFTKETAGFQYKAKLQLHYNGVCSMETAPVVLAREAARWSAAIPEPGQTPGR